MQQQKYCGDQSAGMADANPPYEVDNREAPGNRDIDSPHANADDQ